MLYIVKKKEWMDYKNIGECSISTEKHDLAAILGQLEQNRCRQAKVSRELQPGIIPLWGHSKLLILYKLSVWLVGHLGSLRCSCISLLFRNSFFFQKTYINLYLKDRFYRGNKRQRCKSSIHCLIPQMAPIGRAELSWAELSWAETGR